MRIGKVATQAIGILVVLILGICLTAGHTVYRTMTFDETVITPTNYELIRNDASNIREVFAVEGEYRMTDTWFLPHNRSTGKWANEIERASKLNQASATRQGSYEVQCNVRTWGVRYDTFSVYPHIYETRCYKVEKPISAFSEFESE